MAKQKMKTVDMSVKPEDVDAQIASQQGDSDVETTEAVAAVAPGARPHIRSHKYQAVKSRVDRTKNYPLAQAVELVLKTSYSKFAGTVIADMVVKDDKVAVEVSFPHSTGRTTRVAVASDELLAAVEAGTIDFDVLVAHPSFMPKIARLAKILGPKGLMPNPKNGTVSADPEKRAKELAGGKTSIKTERKAPLIHAVIGKTNQSAKELAENTEALVKAIGSTKITKLTLAATMSPGVKVDLTKFTSTQ